LNGLEYRQGLPPELVVDGDGARRFRRQRPERIEHQVVVGVINRRDDGAVGLLRRIAEELGADCGRVVGIELVFKSNAFVLRNGSELIALEVIERPAPRAR
jgi:hypothetical protein